MASAKKIKDNLFSISWSAVYGTPQIKAAVPPFSFGTPLTSASSNQNHKQTVEVKNHEDIFRFCQLSYTTIGANGFLEVEIQFSKAIKLTNMEKILIEASKNGVKQKMTVNQSNKWTTCWNGTSCHNCHTHTRCSQCGMHPTIGFEILIDLTPGSSKKRSKNVLDHLLNLWKTKTLADVEFHFNGKSIKAHTLILASGSPVLAAMFQNDFKENKDKVVDVADIKANIFENLLQYIYTGEAKLETEVEDVTELLVAADKYGVETLKEECALYLSNDLKAENAARYLVFAHLHNSSVLLESTLQFMSKNAKAVCSRKEWMDIIKNYPELCFQATQLMVGL